MSTFKLISAKCLCVATLLFSGLLTLAQSTSECIIPGPYYNPAAAPDGKSIAFTGSGMDGIYILKENGTGITTLTRASGAGYKFTWSADNTHIGYRGTRFAGNTRKQFIALINIADKTDTVFFESGRIQPPVWLYSVTEKSLLALDGEKLSTLSTLKYAPGFNYNMSLSRPALFYRNGRLWAPDTDGQLRENSLNFQGMDPVWHPTENKVLFSREGHIWIRDFDTGNEEKIVKGCHPSWAPDGKRFAFEINTDDGHFITSSDLYIYNLTNGSVTQLTATGTIHEAYPCWMPDSKRILCHDEKAGGIYCITLSE